MVSHSNHPASPAAQPGSVDSASSGQSADELKRNIQWKEIYEQNLSIISELMLSGIHLKLHSNILIYNWNPNQELHNNNFTIVFVTIPSLLGGVLLSTLLVVCFKVWKQRLMSGYVHYIYIHICICSAVKECSLCSQTGDRWYNPSVRHIAHTYQSSVRLLLAGEKIKKTGSHFSLLAHPGHFPCVTSQKSASCLGCCTESNK